MPIKNLLPVELPDLPGFSSSPEEILGRMIATYEAAYQRETGQSIKLAYGDDRRIELQTNALIVYQLESLIKYLASQNYIAYAKGAYLDNISATRGGPERAGSSSAVVTMRFAFSKPLVSDEIIPVGTRVTAEGSGIYFATNKAQVVPAGSTQWEGVFTCQTAGAVGNNFLAGQVAVLVDPLIYVQSVVSIDDSQGGVDLESDDHYAEVVYLSPEGYSVAGPELAYEYLAKAYSPEVADVKVYSPTPGVVSVVPILQGGVVPTSAFLSELAAFLSAKDKRPETDFVQVSAPDTILFDVVFIWYLSGDAQNQSAITAAIEGATQDYIAWQKARMGRDINPQELIRRVLAAGAKRLDIISPVHTIVEPNAVAIATDPVITLGGLEDE